MFRRILALMPPGEHEGADEIVRLRHEMEWLLHNQAAVDRRLGRVEDSMVFRALRAIGRVYQTRVARTRAGQSRGYAEWRLRTRTDAPPRPAPTTSSRIGLVLIVENPQREKLRRAIDSVRSQTYLNAKLVALCPPNSPQWTRDLLDDRQIPCAPDWERAVALTEADYVGTVRENGFLSPTALEHFAAAFPADLLYSDEDIVDPSSNPLRPLFKPDWSPVLLRSVPYLGGLVLRRRDANAAEPATVVHIPRVLFHAEENPLPSPVRPAPVLGPHPLVNIIVCTRTARLIERCLSAIRERTHYPQLQITVVQHLGSTNAREESAVAAVVERFDARRIAFSAAFNFAEMNNEAARATGGEILLFLNDDVEPLTSDWLDRLVFHLESPQVGAVGAKLVYPSGALQHAGIATWLVDGAGHPGRNLFTSANWPWLNYTREVTAVTGACLAIRRADFERVGGFDPLFPVNYNDVDLCLRLREEGFSVVIDTGAVLRHAESQTRRPGTAYDERRLFFARWASVVSRVDPFYSPHLAQNNEDLSLR